MGRHSGTDRQSVAATVRPATRWISSASMRAVATWSGVHDRRQTNESNAAGNWSVKAAAIAIASRVFPAPPGPVRLSSRTSGRSSNSVASDTLRSRPISEVRGMGRLYCLQVATFGPRERLSAAECNSSGGVALRHCSDNFAVNKYPRRGTVFSNCWARSSSARRNSRAHCTSESSVTKASGHTACISSCLPTRHPACSTKYFSVSYTLGRSLISSPAFSTRPLRDVQDEFAEFGNSCLQAFPFLQSQPRSRFSDFLWLCFVTRGSTLP